MEAVLEKERKAGAERMPCLFISHKHEDCEIADTISNFASEYGIEVFHSSNPRYEGPRQGMSLSEEIKKALWKADVVILIYTADDKNWSWCMHECGLAIIPNSPGTKVIVIQCLEDEEPPVYRGNHHVRAWDAKSIYTFVKSFLTKTAYFPTVIAPRLEDARVESTAAKLHESLQKAIKKKAKDRPACPFMQIELTENHTAQIDKDSGCQKAKAVLLAGGKVVKAELGAESLFGLTQKPSHFKKLVEAWQDEYPGRPLEWLDVLSRQLANAVAGKKLRAHRTFFREVGGHKRYIMGISRVHTVPSEEKMRFDIYFFYNSEAEPVMPDELDSSPMIGMEGSFYLDLDREQPDHLTLENLLKRFAGYKRVPIIREGYRPVCVLHVSMIDKFIRQRLFRGGNVGALTLADLLKDPEIEPVLKNTFVVVNRHATIEDAARKIALAQRIAGVRPRSVFVTEIGSADEPVLSWRTDHAIDRIERPFTRCE